MAPIMSHGDRGASLEVEFAPRSKGRGGDEHGLLDRPRFSALAAPRPPSDEALVASMRRGNPRAFDTLVARYQTRLFWFCWQIVRSKEDVEDALQDVFASAYNAILANDREIQVRPWLYRIARNRCINQLRRARTAVAGSIDAHHPDLGPSVVETVVGRQQFRHLVTDMQALPDTQRTALLLCEIDGLSYQQIALAMGKTVPGVKSLLVRARTNLLSSAVARGTTRHGGSARTRTPARRGSPPRSYRSARAAARNLA